MGKKTKKTRWRTLSIGGTCSDTESQNGINEQTKTNPKYGNKTNNNGLWCSSSSSSSNHHKFASYSYNSTPVKYHQQQRNQSNGHYYNRAVSHQETSKSTTRSSSTVSEHKITFNEDEYTRITTPRQDVLFKKGYLNKPKPYLQHQRSLTSTGNSTGDGTPDHQSADGNDLADDYDHHTPGFVYPGNSGFMDANNVGMYFVNGFEPYAVPPHHVLVYDQYGNAAVCFPPPQLPPPPTVFERRSKRYSTDSMTESTSPHNESNQDAASTFNDTDEPFIVLNDEQTIKETETDTPVVKNDDKDMLEARIRKKRRRKRIEKTKNENEEEELSSELSSLSCDDDEENVNETDLKNCKYRVDAEEFVPRSYRAMQQMEFVPLPVGMPFPTELYAGAFVPAVFVPSPPPPSTSLAHHQIFFNNPHHHQQLQQPPEEPQQLQEEQQQQDQDHQDDNIEETHLETNDSSIEVKELETNTTNTIDIAKIVSKLEQAAFEQKRVEQKRVEQSTVVPETTEQNKDIVTDKTADIKINKTEKKFNNKKCEFVPTINNVRYSERLKQSQQKTIKPTPPLNSSNNISSTSIKQQQQNKRKTCPRLERTAATVAVATTVLTTTTSVTTGTSSNNQWISVSGKKKRGKNKQLPPEIEPNPISDVADTIIVQQQEAIVEQQKTNKDDCVVAKKQTDDVETSIVDTKQESKKQRTTTTKNTTNPKKQQQQQRKRIIINDEQLLTPKNVEVVAAKTEIVQTNKPTKKKSSSIKKLNKPKYPVSNNNESICNNNNINGDVDDELLSITETVLTTNNDDVSLELDRMIQRGLYGNLEQRLRSFNPTDSFIVDVLKPNQDSVTATTSATKRFDTNVNAATAAASLIGTMAAAVLKKPSSYSINATTMQTPTTNGLNAPKIVVTQEKQQVEPVTIKVRHDSESSTTNDEHFATNARFPITRAVREWMNKTRENTPEVEIFKKPNEIRQEFLIIDDAAVAAPPPPDNFYENGVEIQETNIDQPDDEMYNTKTTLPNLNPRSCRTSESTAAEDDLLDCWETAPCSTNNTQTRRRTKSSSIESDAPIDEQGEDVLETYESVYGNSNDFERIQREIHQQQQQQQQQQRTTLLNNNLRSGVGIDGALPYRAICCSIM